MDRFDISGIRLLAFSGRPAWQTMIQAVEQVTGRRWKEMTANYEDTGRDALLAVATRHLGWRLSEVVREVPGLSCAAAQGIRRFWARFAEDKESVAVAGRGYGPSAQVIPAMEPAASAPYPRG